MLYYDSLSFPAAYLGELSTSTSSLLKLLVRQLFGKLACRLLVLGGLSTGSGGVSVLLGWPVLILGGLRVLGHLNGI